ncbi:2-acylglycerol O-acyltransferase 1 isoform X2 [Vombatus ursinus]|uniref:2-acylglycerol O-acyltransferase 1 isoform X2 n=1 Tax=Vombatus ursinus TaxID=29139 RepID=UPI000FFD00FD|nr:2-acylglycerol O-acyltransferase 1 isoform X2 [Vombatus ursinus]
MKVQFAPINIPLERRLQTAAVLQWVLSFLLLGQLCCGLFVILLYKNYWFLYVPYLTWLYFDWKTPDSGGRRFDWIRNWTVWKYFREYFPMQELFPGFTAYLHTLPYWFRCPFFREYLMSSGAVSVSKQCVSHVLSKKKGGNISVIVLGGAEESLVAHPGSFTLFVSQRKGFIKMALTHGAYLVPVFSFGENELFKQVNNPEGSWLRAVQEKLYQKMGFTLPLFHARGVFQYSFGLMPYRKPIFTVVGHPIPVQQNLHPTPEQIDELHQTYLEELRKLFEKHKRKYGISEQETLIFK